MLLCLRKLAHSPDICSFFGLLCYLVTVPRARWRYQGSGMLCYGMWGKREASTMKTKGKNISVHLSANGMVPRSTEGEKRVTASPVTVSPQPRCPGKRESLIYSSFPSEDGPAFSCLPLSPSSPQQGTSIPRKENNGILYITPNPHVSSK